jgi:hypothetical protein
MHNYILKYGYSLDGMIRYFDGEVITREHPIVQELIEEFGDFWWMKWARIYQLTTEDDGTCSVIAYNRPVEIPSTWEVQKEDEYIYANPNDAIRHIGYTRAGIGYSSKGSRQAVVTLDGVYVTLTHKVASEIHRDSGDQWWMPKHYRGYSPDTRDWQVD